MYNVGNNVEVPTLWFQVNSLKNEKVRGDATPDVHRTVTLRVTPTTRDLIIKTRQAACTPTII